MHPPDPDDEAPADREEKAFATRFRVVRVDGERRGIRLEEIFWTTLEEMAAQRAVKLGDIVRGCEEEPGASGNVSSALRVASVRFLRDRLEHARARTGLQLVKSQIQATPSPCFALSEGKKIVAFNQPFMSFVQSRLSRLPVNSSAQSVRLSLDVPFSDLSEKLKQAGSGPLALGFVIGVDNQVIRGRLNATMAPILEQDVVVGHILPA